VLCALDVERFATRLAALLAEGQRLARAALDPVENARGWVEWHRDLPPVARPAAAAGAVATDAGHPVGPDPAPSRGDPLVSVCIAHYDRPALLEQMLASLERQTFSRFEVIVADDGSRRPETGAALDRLAARLEARGGTLVRGPNRGPALARHHGAERARGRYLLFLDDDDVAEPHAIETLVGAAERSGVDALVPFSGASWVRIPPARTPRSGGGSCRSVPPSPRAWSFRRSAAG
jgi:hypothetical protein